eukprot:766950-Hanusia_phi.AAC.5
MKGIDGGFIRHGRNQFTAAGDAESFSAFKSGLNGTFYWDQPLRTLFFYSLRNISVFEEIALTFNIINPVKERPACNVDVALLGGDANLSDDLPPPLFIFLEKDLSPTDVLLFVSNPYEGLGFGNYIKVGFEIMQIQEVYSTIITQSMDAVSNIIFLRTVSEISKGVILKVDQELMKVQSIESSLIFVSRGEYGSAVVQHVVFSNCVIGKILVKRGIANSQSSSIHYSKNSSTMIYLLDLSTRAMNFTLPVGAVLTIDCEDFAVIHLSVVNRQYHLCRSFGSSPPAAHVKGSKIRTWYILPTKLETINPDSISEVSTLATSIYRGDSCFPTSTPAFSVIVGSYIRINVEYMKVIEILNTSFFCVSRGVNSIQSFHANLSIVNFLTLDSSTDDSMPLKIANPGLSMFRIEQSDAFPNARNQITIYLISTVDFGGLQLSSKTISNSITMTGTNGIKHLYGESVKSSGDIVRSVQQYDEFRILISFDHTKIVEAGKWYMISFEIINQEAGQSNPDLRIMYAIFPRINRCFELTESITANASETILNNVCFQGGFQGAYFLLNSEILKVNELLMDGTVKLSRAEFDTTAENYSVGTKVHLLLMIKNPGGLHENEVSVRFWPCVDLVQVYGNSFLFMADEEIMSIKSNSGCTMTVERGLQGSRVAFHPEDTLLLPFVLSSGMMVFNNQKLQEYDILSGLGFIVSNIGQSSADPGITNYITITLATNSNLLGKDSSYIQVSGLRGSLTKSTGTNAHLLTSLDQLQTEIALTPINDVGLYVDCYLLIDNEIVRVLEFANTTQEQGYITVDKSYSFGFNIGQYVKVENETMCINEIDKSQNGSIYVDRGQLGTNRAIHQPNSTIRLLKFGTLRSELNFDSNIMHIKSGGLLGSLTANQRCLQIDSEFIKIIHFLDTEHILVERGFAFSERQSHDNESIIYLEPCTILETDIGWEPEILANVTNINSTLNTSLNFSVNLSETIAQFTSEVNYSTTNVSISFQVRSSLIGRILTGCYLQVNTEIMKVTSVDSNNVTVRRCMLDTCVASLPVHRRNDVVIAIRSTSLSSKLSSTSTYMNLTSIEVAGITNDMYVKVGTEIVYIFLIGIDDKSIPRVSRGQLGTTAQDHEVNSTVIRLDIDVLNATLESTDLNIQVRIFPTQTRLSLYGFKIGNMIRIDNEVLRIDSFGNGYITVNREQIGTRAAYHTNGSVVELESYAVLDQILDSNSSNFTSFSLEVLYGASTGCVVQIDDELMQVTKLFQSGFEVIRGFLGTEPAYHGAGSSIYLWNPILSMSNILRIERSTYATKGGQHQRGALVTSIIPFLSKEGLQSAFFNYGVASWNQTEGSAIINFYGNTTLNGFGLKERILRLENFSAAGLQDGDFIQIDQEILQIVNISEGTIFVNRNLAFTSASPHREFATVKKRHISLVLDSINSSQTALNFYPPQTFLKTPGVYVSIDGEIIQIEQILSNYSVEVKRGAAKSQNKAINQNAAIELVKQSFLSSDISDTSTNTIALQSVSSCSIFVGDFIQVEDEVLLVLAINQNNLTVSRGQASSSAATHRAGAAVIAIRSTAIAQGWSFLETATRLRLEAYEIPSIQVG